MKTILIANIFWRWQFSYVVRCVKLDYVKAHSGIYADLSIDQTSLNKEENRITINLFSSLNYEKN